MLAYRKLFNYLSLVTIILSTAACNKDENIGDGSKIEGAPCSNSNECSNGLICVDEICSKICNNHGDCAKYQMCDPTQKICRNNSGLECSADADCTKPGQCEVQRDAICQGGICVYQPKEAGTTCDDEKLCTVNDQCDGAKNCVGSQMPCNTPPKNYCTDDSTFRTYKETGSCSVVDGAPKCNYSYTDSECFECPKNCGNFCENVDCTPLNQPGLCQEQVCDYNSENDPPCSPQNKIDNSVCKYQDENSEKILDGFCRAGECVECITDNQCANTSSYPECQIIKCEDNKCVRTSNNDLICGGASVCKNGRLYSERGLCSSDGMSCNANNKSCGNYQCNAEGNDCLTSCKSGNDCQDGFFCNNDNQCQAKIANGEACIPAFNGNDCVSGHCDQLNDDETKAVCCASGNCCLDSDSNCSSTQKCLKSLFQCVSGDEGSLCQNDNDCNDTLYCSKLNNACAKKLANGQKICSADNECISNHCDLSTLGSDTGRCCESGECCGNKNDCPANQVCKKGSCTIDDSGTPCENNNDCNSLTSYCAPNDQGEKVCTAKKGNGADCTLAEECNSGYCIKYEGRENGLCCSGKCTDPNMSCIDNDFPENNGECRKKTGQGCKLDSECQSGHCIDGFCCGPTFNLCRNKAKCANEIETYYTCGRPGYEGECVEDTRSCGYYLCDNVSLDGCWKQCTGNTQCKADAYCDKNGHCQPKADLGQPCAPIFGGASANNSCAKGYCVDGVCCDTKCNGICESCNQDGNRGSCTPIDDNFDDTCDIDGKGCGGSGFSCICGRDKSSNISCRYTLGSKCQNDADCSSNICTSGVCCDGKGICHMSGQGKADGEICNTNGECESNHCTDGVCCNTECSLTCQSCDQPGKRGTCSPVFGHRDDDTCTTGKGLCQSGDCICDGSASCRSSSSRHDPETIKQEQINDCAWGEGTNSRYLVINGTRYDGYYCAYGQPAGSPCSANNFGQYDYHYSSIQLKCINKNYPNNGRIYNSNISSSEMPLLYYMTDSAGQPLSDIYSRPNTYGQTTLAKNTINNLSISQLLQQIPWPIKLNDTYYDCMPTNTNTNYDNRCMISYYYSSNSRSSDILENCAPAQGGGICESGICLDRCCKAECEEDYCFMENNKFYIVVHYCDQNGDCQSQTALADAGTCKGYSLRQ